MSAECCGVCVMASDIGMGEYGDVVVTAYPGCPEHDPNPVAPAESEQP